MRENFKLFIAAFSMLLALTVLLTSCLTELEEIVIVKFDGNGGAPVPEEREIIKGKVLGSVDDPVKGTEQFLGWYSDFDRYEANTVVYAHITLTAKWKSVEVVDTVTVTFSSPGAVPALTLVEVAVGKAIGPLFPVDPRMEGSWFDGWEVGGEPFTRTYIVTEAITVTPKYRDKNMFTVTLNVPEIHRDANPGVHSRQFWVYEGDSIDEWEKRFPLELNTAPDPNDDQFHTFFRWSEGGLPNGIIYTERTPVEKNVSLGAIYGLYFHKKTFDVDLTTLNSRVSMNEYRVPPYENRYREGPDVVGEGGSDDPVRLPLVENWVVNADDSVSFTVHAQPTLMYFRPPVELWKLLKIAEVTNDTRLSFWLDYEFENPAQEDDDNKLNIFFGNLLQNDNWNSSEVRDITWKDIVYGQEVNGERPNQGELHKLAATIINFDQNVDWIIMRMGRIDTKVPFRATIKAFKVTVEQ